MALSVADIITDPEVYSAQRPSLRARILPVRAERRIRVGDMLLFEFENEQTLRYQVQEMVYTERLRDPSEVAHEIDIYSRLLPSSHTLTATLFIELDVLDAVRAELERLAGVQRSIRLEIGGVPVPAEEILGPDEDPDVPSQTVSVHMLRFLLNDDTRDAFRDPAVPVELVVDHPAYNEATPITGTTRTSLIADLALRG
ncbi:MULTISPECIES: DUF3501 family protein [Protofrankia]|uniref:DUF3501 family protein n=2 Tax=Protofrankia TaxID=2994361 RepID=F8AYH9_9ACTN|nr:MULTISPECIES: DUF3501 family protein [Protofrankia]AEH10491.1 hypothetical protein FsymDg_3183 [Candidatus Protofrankia datiscae]KLL10263.1 hypothetical protein FrCorBMG51_19335 [Protofrankia coriariae]ONH37204.1 hypothetical protein BL254_03840 [Protofrankia sp. BMG5.30]